jgi:hypothetical protein
LKSVHVVAKSNDQQPTGKGGSYRPELVPISQPPRAGGECFGRLALRLLRPLRNKHDLSAVKTLRKVSKRLQTLVIGQDVFGKRTELVRIRMPAGMEKFAHGV